MISIRFGRDIRCLGAKEKLEENMMDVRILAHQIRKELNRKKILRSPSITCSLIEMRQMYENESKATFRRIKESQIEAIAKKFCLTMEKYYRAIVIYRETCKERVQRQYHLAGFIKNDAEIERILEYNSFSMYPQV